jgi:hypothetical protein
MACTTCSRSGTALPSSDKTLTLTGRATLVVPAGTYAASVSARLIDQDDMPDLAKAVLCDAAEARINTRQSQQQKVRVTFADVNYGTYNGVNCLAYQGKSIIDPNGWMPVPTADLLRDASNRVIGAKIMLSAGHLVVVTAP